MSFNFFRFVGSKNISKLSGSLLLGISLTSSLAHNESSPSSIALSRPKGNYTRIDSLLEKAHPEWKSNNAFHGTLRGENMIEEYEVYSNNDAEEIVCLVRYGRSLNGHTGIVHGGITALTFDNSFGWLFLANKYPPAFTANISVNYRKKIPENSLVILKAKVAELKGRKLFMTATMEDVEGNILADSNSLFIVIKDAPEGASVFPPQK